MALKPLKGLADRKSLGEHVFETLKKAIISGHIHSSQRLVESRIAQSLSISRTPVREALHKLEQNGWLMKQPRGGFIVSGLTRADIEETFGIRRVLESYAVRLAAQKHDPRQLIELEEKIADFQHHLDQGRLDVLTKINTEFHDLLYALSQSPKLIKMINELRDQIYRYRKMILRIDQMAAISNEDHRQILNLIRQRDADGAEKRVKAHILRGQTIVLDAIDQKQV